MTIHDTLNRNIDYLRISVTDRCNLRCLYCMPEEGVKPLQHSDILRYEEITTIARAAANLGIRFIRLTGGEPLARLGLINLVAALAAIPGIEEISMTTNGTLLAKYAEQLAAAGLNRINISLDTLRPERYTHITRWGNLTDVLDGIDAAYRYNLRPVKINSVIIRNINDDEVVDLSQKTITDGWNLRFIEWMPVGEVEADKWNFRFVSESEIKAKIEAALGPLEDYGALPGSGPAHTCKLPGSKGTIGFISAVSQHFCAQCNRLRLTADGYIRPCLLADNEIDIRSPLREGAPLTEIEDILRKAILAKPTKHHLDQVVCVTNRSMSQIGG
jgi:cyclic pyranopterin phosphate synthase